MSKKLLLTALIGFVALTASAREMTTADTRNQYKPYPQPTRQLTSAPAGYEVFHMEHYGRHGSRWLTDSESYAYPVEQLARAERNGVLTDEGKDVLSRLRQIEADSKGRVGELTPLGARQHRGIAKRMAANFPTLFAPGTCVDAKSTVIIRCILSMLNAVQELSAAQPRLVIKTDASEHDMYYTNFHDKERGRYKDAAVKQYMPAFMAARANKGDFLRRLVNDDKFIRDSLDTQQLFSRLYEVASNIVSHDGDYAELMPLFTDEEIRQGAEIGNAFWALEGAYSQLTQNKNPRSQRNLLSNMILSADTAMTSAQKSVNLRFGHDGVVLPLVSLMELDKYGREFHDMDKFSEDYHISDIIPMACNIQMVFYRPKGSLNPNDVLVKILLNEEETTIAALPTIAPGSPYYLWADLRSFLARKAEL